MNIRNKEDEEINKKKMVEIWKNEYENNVDDIDNENYEIEEERLIKLLNKDDLNFDDFNEDEKKMFLNDMKKGFYKKYLKTWNPWWYDSYSEHIKNMNEKIKVINDDDDEDIDIIENNLYKGDKIYCVNYADKKLPKITVDKANKSIIYNIISLVLSYIYSIKLYNGNYNEDLISFIDLIYSTCPSLINKVIYNSYIDIFIDFNIKLKVVENEKRNNKLDLELEKDLLTVIQIKHYILDIIYNVYSILNIFILNSNLKSKKERILRKSSKSCIKKLEYYYNYIENINEIEWQSITFSIQNALIEINPS